MVCVVKRSYSGEKVRWDVTFVHGRTTECEDSARILKQNSQYGASHSMLALSSKECSSTLSFRAAMQEQF